MGRRTKKGGAEKPTIQITRESKDGLVAWIEAHKNPQQSLVVGSIVGWFIKQPPFVQQVVMDDVPGEMRLAYAAALREMARQLEGDPHANITLKSTTPPKAASAASAAPAHAQSKAR